VSGGVPLIQSQAALEVLFERLRGTPLLAVDTEAASFHRFIDRVYLLQISSREETAVVDPLAVESLAPLAEVLADPAVEIVFHDADYDLRLLDREYGFRATTVFDTRIAAQLLNEPGVGLAALLEKYLGVRLDKRFQRADWSARPLSAEMLGTRRRTRVTAQAARHPQGGWRSVGCRGPGGVRAARRDPLEPSEAAGIPAPQGRQELKGRGWRSCASCTGGGRVAQRADGRRSGSGNEPMLAMAAPAGGHGGAQGVPGIGGEQASGEGGRFWRR
jgi:hypothetical protein